MCVRVHIFKRINVEWDQSKTHTNHLSSDLHRMTINQRLSLSLSVSFALTSRVWVSWIEKAKDMPLVFSAFFSLLNPCIESPIRLIPLPPSSFSPHSFPSQCHYPKMSQFFCSPNVFCCLLFFLFHARFSGTLFTLVISRQLHHSALTTTNWQHKIQPYSYSVFTDKDFNSMRICQVDMCTMDGRDGGRSSGKKIKSKKN